MKSTRERATCCFAWFESYLSYAVSEEGGDAELASGDPPAWWKLKLNQITLLSLSPWFTSTLRNKLTIPLQLHDRSGLFGYSRCIVSIY